MKLRTFLSWIQQHFVVCSCIKMAANHSVLGLEFSLVRVKPCFSEIRLFKELSTAGKTLTVHNLCTEPHLKRSDPTLKATCGSVEHFCLSAHQHVDLRLSS